MKKYPILIFLVLFILSTVAFASSPPADWWGKVSISDMKSSNGAVVSAYVNGELRSSAVVGALMSNYYLIHVEGQMAM